MADVGSDIKDSEEDEVQASPSALRPASIPEDMWEAIPEDLRQEAVERAAWICLRSHIRTTQAIQLALSGMEADMQQLEVEPPWSLVRALLPFAPFPRRDRHGRIDPDILETASTMENEARWAFREGMTGIAPDVERRRGGDIAANRKRLVMERVHELVTIYGPIESIQITQ